MSRKRLFTRSVRLRLTGLYGVLFVVSGAVLLAIASGLTISSTSEVAAVPTQAVSSPGTALGQAQAKIRHLQAQLSARNTASVSHQLLMASAIALGIMAAASVVFGWIMAGRALRPVRAMTEAAQRISADNLHERLAVSGPADELKDLGDTIDGLLERLEQAFSAQRLFVANASHELRTPLTTMRAAIDVAMAKPAPVPPQTTALADRLRAELDQVDELLEGLLVLARAQHSVLPDHAVFSLSDVVAVAVAERASAIAARDLALQLRLGTGAAVVAGSQALMSRLAGNLLDNAIVHNEHAGWLCGVRGGGCHDGHRFGDRGKRRRGVGSAPGVAARPAIPAARCGPDRIGQRLGPWPVDRHGHRFRARRDGGHPGQGRRRAPRHRDTAAGRLAGAGRSVCAGKSVRMRVLVVEDSRSLAEVLVEGLRDQGMAVDSAHDGLEAAAKLGINSYDVVVLDRDLPGIHGDVLCQMITDRDDRVMVLMLTAAGDPGDRVSGLGLGADDYLAKPFHFPELVLRLRSLARRQPSARGRILRAGGIELDPVRRTVSRDGRQVDLSVKEFGVLEALLRAAPAFLRAEDLLEQVWDEHADPFTNTVTVTIGRLRRKLGEPQVIATTPGVGYRIAGSAGRG